MSHKFPAPKPTEKKEIIVLNESIIIVEGERYKKDHEGKELEIIQELIRENSRLIELLGRLIPTPPVTKMNPVLAFNIL